MKGNVRKIPKVSIVRTVLCCQLSIKRHPQFLLGNIYFSCIQTPCVETTLKFCYVRMASVARTYWELKSPANLCFSEKFQIFCSKIKEIQQFDVIKLLLAGGQGTCWDLMSVEKHILNRRFGIYSEVVRISTVRINIS